MGVVKGALWGMVTISQFHTLPCSQFCKKIILRLSEHGDVIITNSKSLA